LFLVQSIILTISLLLFFDILQTDIFLKDSNTFSLSLRLILYLPFLFFLNRFLLKKAIIKKNIYSVLILLSLCIILDGLGEILGWYNLARIIFSIQYDDILHFLCPIFLTISLCILFDSLLKVKTLVYILSLTSLSFLICIWEIYEYWSDYLFKTKLIGDLHDTILDMTLGIAGGIVAIFLFKMIRKFDYSLH
jgi:hypothetical protein